jgi:hypothetical protein
LKIVAAGSRSGVCKFADPRPDAGICARTATQAATLYAIALAVIAKPPQTIPFQTIH